MTTVRCTWPAAAIALAALAGCTVNNAKEAGLWQGPLEQKMAAPAPAPAPDDVLTLRQALEMANRHNERLALGGEDYVQALIEKDRSASRLLPHVAITPMYTELEPFSAPGPVGSLFPIRTTDVPVGVALNVDLKDLANVAKAEVLAQYRLALLLDLQAAILADTAALYYRILQLERQIQVLEHSVMVQEDRVQDMRAKFRAGVVRELDVRQTEAQAAATRAPLVDARNKRLTARAGLALLIGVPAVPNPLADGFEVPDVPPLEEMQKTAADVRPDVQAALALVTAAHRGLGAAIAEYFPSFSVDFDRWLTRQSFPPDSRWLFGASANIPIFTGGKTYADVRTAYSLVRQARQYESLTRRQAAEEVAVAWNNFEASDRLIREYETEVAAASDASALADQSYDVGLVTNLDRLVVQDRLLQAQLQLAAERLNRKILYFRLAEAVGELVDRVAGRTASPPPPAGPQAQAEKSPAFRLTAETPETKGKDSSR